MTALLTHAYFWLTMILLFRQQWRRTTLRKQAETILRKQAEEILDTVTGQGENKTPEEHAEVSRRIAQARELLDASMDVKVGIYFIAHAIGLTAMLLLLRD